MFTKGTSIDARPITTWRSTRLLATLRSEKTHARKEEPKPEPAVTQEQLDELEPGDTVFHKAFGYGRLIDLDEAYIEVTFDSDGKKKPSRKFLFPGSFSQGLLQIG